MPKDSTSECHITRAIMNAIAKDTPTNAGDKPRGEQALINQLLKLLHKTDDNGANLALCLIKLYLNASSLSNSSTSKISSFNILDIKVEFI